MIKSVTDSGNDLTLKVSELFYSLQGESTYAGLPCVFIRLADCNLRCSFCDSRFTYEEQPVEIVIRELLEYSQRYPDALIEITGGEPLLQENVYPLMKEFLHRERKVLLETNGSVDISRVPNEVVKIMDIKCPGSGMHDRMNLSNLAFLSPEDEVKFVISSRQDYDWAVDFIKENFSDPATSPEILFSSAWKAVSPKLLGEWLLESKLPYRLQVQLHKILWPDKERGV